MWLASGYLFLRRLVDITPAPNERNANDVGSGVSVAPIPPVKPDAFGLIRPKLLRTSERSVKSIVAALSKFPEVQAAVLAPKLLRTTERSLRST